MAEAIVTAEPGKEGLANIAKTQDPPVVTAPEDDVKGILDKYGLEPNEANVKLAKAYKEVQQKETESGQLTGELKRVIDGLSEQKAVQERLAGQQNQQSTEEIRKQWVAAIDDPDPEKRLNAIYALASQVANNQIQATVAQQLAYSQLTDDEKKIMADATKRGERLLPETVKALARGMKPAPTAEEIERKALAAKKEEADTFVESGNNATPIHATASIGKMNKETREGYEYCLSRGLVKNVDEYMKIRSNRSFDGGTEKKRKLEWK